MFKMQPIVMSHSCIVVSADDFISGNLSTISFIAR